MKSIASVIFEDTISSFLLKYRRFIKKRYNKFSDVCYISHEKNFLVFSTGHASGKIEIYDKAFHYIRKQCGQSLLTLNGIQDEPIYLLLYINPLLLLKLGIKNFFRSIKSWTGQSCTENNYIVVRYILFPWSK